MIIEKFMPLSFLIVQTPNPIIVHQNSFLKHAMVQPLQHKPSMSHRQRMITSEPPKNMVSTQAIITCFVGLTIINLLENRTLVANLNMVDILVIIQSYHVVQT